MILVSLATTILPSHLVSDLQKELNMEQIITMEDEEGNEGLRIINATFADPYMLILRDDSSAKLYKASGDGEVEEVEAEGFTSTQWLSASLYKSSAAGDTYAFLLTHQGGLHVSFNPTRRSWVLTRTGLRNVRHEQASIRRRRAGVPASISHCRVLPEKSDIKGDHHRDNSSRHWRLDVTLAAFDREITLPFISDTR